MALPQGVDFRNTSGYVTDPTNCDYEIGTTANYPHMSAQGNNIGWEDDPSAALDRDNTAGLEKVAGDHYFTAATPEYRTYRIELPSAGTYKFRLAMGDHVSSSPDVGCELFDDVTSLGFLITSHQSITTDHYYDATDTERTSGTDWVNNNQLSAAKTFSSTICRFKFGPNAAAFGGIVFINHIWVESASTDVTVGATGSQVAASRGTLLPQISIGAVGTQVDISRGTIVPQISKGLTGSQIASTRGTLSPESSIGLIGSENNFSQGTLSVQINNDVTVAAIGSQIGFSRGTLSTAILLALTGNSLLLSEGALSPSPTTVFSNISVTSDATNVYVTFDTSINLSGGVAGFSYSINSPTTAPLTWWVDVIGLVTHQGLIIPWADLGAVSGDTIYVDVGYSLTNPAGDKVFASDEGVSVSSVSTSTSDVTVGLTGQQISNSLGTLGLGISIPLFGSQVIITNGNLSPSISGNITIALTGKLITVQQGSLHVLGVGGHYYPSVTERRRRR